MSFKRRYPKTYTLCADLLKSGHALPLSCVVSGGKILPAIAVKQGISAPQNVISAGHMSNANRYFAVTENKLYLANSGKNFNEFCDFQPENAYFYEELESGGFASNVVGGNSCVTFIASGYTERTAPGGVIFGVMKCGRLFGADKDDKTLLRWSGAGGARDWEEGISGAGWAYLDADLGEIIGLFVCGDSLLALREGGITELSVYGNPENFRIVSNTPFLSGISAKGAAAVGEKLYFFGGGGIYTYCGGKTEKLAHNLAGEMSSPVTAAYYGGNYLLSGFSKSLNRRTVLVYDTAEKFSYLVDIPAEAFIMHEGLYAFAGGTLYALDRGAFSLSVKEDFGTYKNKRLARVTVDGECDISVNCDGLERSFSGACGTIRPDMRGESFKITLSGTGEVAGVRAYAEAVNGV